MEDDLRDNKREALEDIWEMAEDAPGPHEDTFMRFAHLVREAERERCAQKCEEAGHLQGGAAEIVLRAMAQALRQEYRP